MADPQNSRKFANGRKKDDSQRNSENQRKINSPRKSYSRRNNDSERKMDSQRKFGRNERYKLNEQNKKENEKAEKPGRRSVSLPPLAQQRTPRSESRVPGWHKRPWSLEPSSEAKRKPTSRNHGNEKLRFKPQITKHNDVWAIYGTTPKLVSPYRPESSFSMKSDRTSRPSSGTSRIQEWRKNTEAAYDTVSQRSLRANKIVHKFVSITSRFERDAEKAKKERERKNKETREKFMKDLKQSRKDFAMRNYKRVEQQFVTPKVLEYEKDIRDGYGLPQNVLIDVDYPKFKKKPRYSGGSSSTSQKKHSQLPESTKYGLKTDEKTTPRNPKKSHDARSASRQKEYQELYRIYCVPGNSRIKDWAREDNAALAIAHNRRSKPAERRRPDVSTFRLNAYRSPYAVSGIRSTQRTAFVY
ncbi:uncharacterized protein LOC111133061 [Crassostrea virginica]